MVWPINEIRACGLWPSYTPKHYYAFRVYDDSELFNYDMFDRRKEKSEAIRNCELWQKITSEVIPLEDIYQVVYKYSYETILNVSRLIEVPAYKPKGRKSICELFDTIRMQGDCGVSGTG